VNVLSLFSGIGGFDIGIERAGFKTVAFCEIEKFPQQILKKHWPDVPIYNDIKLLTKEKLIEDGIDDIGLICGGYPCQPFSVAGKQKGEADDRHLWPEMYRLIKAIRPRWVIAENVAGHINMGLDAVLSDLEAEDYTCWPFVIPACAVNAIHRRDRVWIIGYTEHDGLTASKKRKSITQGNENCETRKNKASELERSSSARIQKDVADTSTSGFTWTRPGTEEYDVAVCSEDAANTKSQRLQGGGEQREGYEKISRNGTQPFNELFGRCSEVFNGFRCIETPTESALCRADDGLSVGLDRVNGVPTGASVQKKKKSKGRALRLKGLGNAVVPQIPELIGRAIISAENNL